MDGVDHTERLLRDCELGLAAQLSTSNTDLLPLAALPTIGITLKTEAEMSMYFD